MFKVPKTSNRYVLLGRFISKTVPNNYMPQPNDIKYLCKSKKNGNITSKIVIVVLRGRNSVGADTSV